MQINGHHIPEGTIVGVNAWVVHYDKAVFGEGADSFRPERWIDDGSERVKKMEKSFFAVSRSITHFLKRRAFADSSFDVVWPWS